MALANTTGWYHICVKERYLFSLLPSLKFSRNDSPALACVPSEIDAAIPTIGAASATPDASAAAFAPHLKSLDAFDPTTEKLWKMLRSARACEQRDKKRAERMYRAALRFAERNWTDDSTNVADALFCLSLFYRKQNNRSASRRCWQTMRRLLHWD